MELLTPAPAGGGGFASRFGGSGNHRRSRSPASVQSRPGGRRLQPRQSALTIPAAARQAGPPPRTARSPGTRTGSRRGRHRPLESHRHPGLPARRRPACAATPECPVPFRWAIGWKQPGSLAVVGVRKALGVWLPAGIGAAGGNGPVAGRARLRHRVRCRGGRRRLLVVQLQADLKAEDVLAARATEGRLGLVEDAAVYLVRRGTAWTADSHDRFISHDGGWAPRSRCVSAHSG